jgi:hypothetical protein
MDYKLMSKVLTAKLSMVAPEIIHKVQAGFMKGRSIFGHIKTIQAVTEYAETIENWDGLIVALDQEKAYNKIRHNYLWKTLENFNLPKSFIETTKTLYKGAETKIMINGFLSSPYKVVRGIRQGDPLSCLLFNLAIEPLVNMIRTSTLEGLKIPWLPERLKALLFADDTTVFLSNMDSFIKLVKILDKWCIASEAKFNKNKTEIIPFRSEEYKNSVRQTRKINQNKLCLPNNIKINNEGELTRILGAWFSNGNEKQPWNMIIDKARMRVTVMTHKYSHT